MSRPKNHFTYHNFIIKNSIFHNFESKNNLSFPKLKKKHIELVCAKNKRQSVEKLLESFKKCTLTGDKQTKLKKRRMRTSDDGLSAKTRNGTKYGLKTVHKTRTGISSNI